MLCSSYPTLESPWLCRAHCHPHALHWQNDSFCPFLTFFLFRISPLNSLDLLQHHLSQETFLWLRVQENCCLSSVFFFIANSVYECLLGTWAPNIYLDKSNKNGRSSYKSVMQSMSIRVSPWDLRASFLILLSQASLTDHLMCRLSPVPSGGSVLCLGCPFSLTRCLCILHISS